MIEYIVGGVDLVLKIVVGLAVVYIVYLLLRWLGRALDRIISHCRFGR